MALIISLIFAFCGLCAIFNDLFDLRYGAVDGYEISLEATIAYCGLLTLCLSPMIFNSHLKISNIRPIRNEHILRFFAWTSFMWFIISTALGWQLIINILTGDMAQYRSDVYNGEGQDWMVALPTPIRFICAIFNTIFGCKWALIFLAFFCLVVQKLPKKYFYLFFISSLSGPLTGIIGADRSATAYWIMSLFAMYLIFRPMMDTYQRKKIVSLGLTIIILLSLYLAAMTIARFGEKEYNGVSGTQGGLISYFGQSFSTFCYFFDNYQPPFIHLGIIFPFFYNHILDVPTSAVLIQQEMSEQTGIFTGVFYTFIGHIIISAGKTTALIYCFIYTILASVILRPICRFKESRISHLYLYFSFASVVYLGLFVHYYAAATITGGLIFIFILLRLIE